MTHSASHAPMDFAIGGGYVQPQRSPREATIRWGVHATGRQPGSRRTAGAPHRRRVRPRPGVRGESRPGRAAPRRIGGRPNGARRPELPPSGGVLAQCGRGRAPRLGGSRRLPRPNDLLLRDLR